MRTHLVLQAGHDGRVVPQGGLPGGVVLNQHLGVGVCG